MFVAFLPYMSFALLPKGYEEWRVAQAPSSTWSRDLQAILAHVTNWKHEGLGTYVQTWFASQFCHVCVAHSMQAAELHGEQFEKGYGVLWQHHEEDRPLCKTTTHKNPSWCVLMARLLKCLSRSSASLNLILACRRSEWYARWWQHAAQAATSGGLWWQLREKSTYRPEPTTKTLIWD